MGKDTEFQRRHGLTYPRLCAAAAGAVFETEIVRKNQEAAIQLLCREIEKLKSRIRELEAGR